MPLYEGVANLNMKLPLPRLAKWIGDNIRLKPNGAYAHSRKRASKMSDSCTYIELVFTSFRLVQLPAGDSTRQRTEVRKNAVLGLCPPTLSPECLRYHSILTYFIYLKVRLWSKRVYRLHWTTVCSFCILNNILNIYNSSMISLYYSLITDLHISARASYKPKCE